MRKRTFFLALLFVLPLLGAMNVSAESDIGLEEAGITMVALRNDTLDLNQDGDVDAVRVVVILNSTIESTIVDVRLIATHNDREVVESTTIEIVGQTNASLTYDAWSRGSHDLVLGFYDMNGAEISSITLLTYEMVPALQTPMLSLQFIGQNNLQTGSNCEINRMFADETGPRYGALGTLTFTGAPFIVLDNATNIDCSGWPAGEYSLRETYRNELGQTAETSLNLTIENRPAPTFELVVNGDGQTTDRSCLIAIQPTNPNEDFAPYTKEWDVSTTSTITEGAVYDCSSLPAGVHLVVLKVTNLENIASTQAVNIVRLPAAELSAEEQEALPSQSFGEETETEAVGWYTISVLGLIVGIVAFVLLVRIREDDELLTLPELGPAPQILNDGSPDSEGLPTIVDDEGQLWRKHPDGSLDWWDTTYNIWQRW
ncbi:MAG: hypothetical protein CMB25_04495 [Euryarchaeota archaeon]|nr:hypothetical protein [Euryarchaeota archaeon]